jgi:uncharacterized protein with ParB-like and HNH nuclease domain
MKGIQNASTDNFGSLIGPGKKYIVPKFQRDYSWNIEQWDDLWQDINRMIEEKNDHYMGYLVLQTSNNKEYLIIDGQQRFTTITLIILACIKSIKKLVEKGVSAEENEKRIDSLMNTYIGNVDPVSLEYDNTLVLNRNNDGYYKEYLVKLGELKRTRISATEKLMKQCFEWFENALDGKFSTGEEYAEFIINVLDNLFFTVITVNDEMNAFRVFETLNARGVQLSSADLLKNYLFSLVDETTAHPGRINTLEEKWFKLTSNLGAEKLPDFLRYYWNSKNRTVRSNELFKAVRKSIIKPEQVFRLMDELLSYSDIYIALKDATDEYWENDTDITKYIELLNLFNLKQPYSLLMAANTTLPTNEFKKILKATIIVSFRYSVIGGRNPNDIERRYNDAALYINKNKRYENSLLKEVYVDDREFVSMFSTKSFIITARNTKIIRYILGEIEHSEGSINIDILDDNNSIEHILPQSPNDEWDIDEEKIERLSPRLGNLCLLEKRLNKEASNKSFDIKKELYKQSSFKTTQQICEKYDQWDENAIASRQSAMSRKAKSIWSIDI